MAAMGRMPNGERAVVDMRKLEEYCLSPSHFRGRHKARVFLQALGLDRSGAFWLREALLEAARTSEAVEAEVDAFGRRWHVDLRLTRSGRTAMIRSVWIIRTGENVPRFITAWVL
jgi:hypothetical protein